MIDIGKHQAALEDSGVLWDPSDSPVMGYVVLLDRDQLQVRIGLHGIYAAAYGGGHLYRKEPGTNWAGQLVLRTKDFEDVRLLFHEASGKDLQAVTLKGNGKTGKALVAKLREGIAKFEAAEKKAKAEREEYIAKVKAAEAKAKAAEAERWQPGPGPEEWADIVAAAKAKLAAEEAKDLIESTDDDFLDDLHYTKDLTTMANDDDKTARHARRNQAENLLATMDADELNALFRSMSLTQLGKLGAKAGIATGATKKAVEAVEELGGDKYPDLLKTDTGRKMLVAGLPAMVHMFLDSEATSNLPLFKRDTKQREMLEAYATYGTIGGSQEAAEELMLTVYKHVLEPILGVIIAQAGGVLLGLDDEVAEPSHMIADKGTDFIDVKEEARTRVAEKLAAK